ncbi:MAG: NAD(P)/FAD-dependent oxidoreductase [FCB group bacterium]|nr:NAD(P)/FAD-dependent oxidoreductase [FCB group bacterium]
MMKNSYDVIVVGGGPSGSMAAKMAAEGGVSVCMLEKDRDIGYPVRCGEAVGELGLKQFVEIKDSWIAASITHFGLVAPDETRVEAKFTNQKGFILHRRLFDYDLAQEAANAGAEVFTKSYVNGLLIENGFVRGVTLDYLGEPRTIRAKIVIGADGVESRVGRWAGIRTQVKMKDIETCVQYSVANIDLDINRIVFYVGRCYAPGGYLWVFPKGERSANIGLGIAGHLAKEKSPKKYLDEFLQREYPGASILTTMCGGVPCAKPMEKPVADGILLVGDAAHHVNAMTGGGIISGMKAGWIGGQVAATAVHSGDSSAKFLQTYVQKVRKDFGDTHNRFYRMKNTIINLTDDDLNAIARQISRIPENERTLTRIFKACVFKKPSLIVDVIKVFAGI